MTTEIVSIFVIIWVTSRKDLLALIKHIHVDDVVDKNPDKYLFIRGNVEVAMTAVEEEVHVDLLPNVGTRSHTVCIWHHALI